MNVDPRATGVPSPGWNHSHAEGRSLMTLTRRAVLAGSLGLAILPLRAQVASPRPRLR